MTNGDRIRQMTDEELASFIKQCDCCSYRMTECDGTGCNDGIYKWLKQRVNTDDDKG